MERTRTPVMQRPLKLFLVALWCAFILRGSIHALLAPMWDGFDEPFHFAYVLFVADHGRPPHFNEKSFPDLILTANRFLPSFLGYGAPSFSEWARMTAVERELRRAGAARETRGRLLGAGQRYLGPNYERQQGPLFYFVAAPVARVLHGASMPQLLVGLRLFCVALASVVVPLSGLLLFRLLGAAGVLVGLPIVALLPNTLFFADRLTNDALAWPLMAAICLLLAEVSGGTASGRRTLLLGVTVSLGIWTKLTLLPALPAAIVAVWAGERAASGRPGRIARFISAVGVPALMTVLLMLWNRSETGTFTGLAQATAANPATLADVVAALRPAFSFSVSSQLLVNHLWSGGWAFLRPGTGWYLGFATLLLFVTLAGRTGGRIEENRPDEACAGTAALRTLTLFFLLAMLFHIVTGSVAAGRVAGFPRIGTEGWYLDLLRPVEALGMAALLLRRPRSQPPFWLCAAVMLLPVAADALGTFGLLIPHWAGGSTGSAVQTFVRAVAAAPLAISSLVVVMLMVSFAMAIVAAAVFARSALNRLPAERESSS